MNRITRTCAIVLIASMVGGCTMVSTEPQSVRWYAPKQDVTLNNVEYSGEYKLWAAAVGVEGTPMPTGSPIVSVRLKPGDALGFTKTTTNEPVAVAAETAYPIKADGSYVWQMKADGGQADKEKNKNNAIFVGALVGTIVLIAVGIAFAA